MTLGCLLAEVGAVARLSNADVLAEARGLDVLRRRLASADHALVAEPRQKPLQNHPNNPGHLTPKVRSSNRDASTGSQEVHCYVVFGLPPVISSWIVNNVSCTPSGG